MKPGSAGTAVRAALGAILAAALGAATAAAQQPTQAQRDAILACLLRNFPALSPLCRAALSEAAGQ